MCDELLRRLKKKSAKPVFNWTSISESVNSTLSEKGLGLMTEVECKAMWRAVAYGESPSNGEYDSSDEVSVSVNVLPLWKISQSLSLQEDLLLYPNARMSTKRQDSSGYATASDQNSIRRAARKVKVTMTHRSPPCASAHCDIECHCVL